MKPAAILLLLTLATPAPAQPREPDPTPPTPEEVERVAPTPRPPPALDLVGTIDEALARAGEAYRAGPLAERIQITLTPAEGPQRSSTVLLRVDAGADSPPRDRRLHLDLGRLQIAADNAGVTAVTPREPEHYFHAPVTAPLTLDQLWKAVPPVPLPQLEWAFADQGHQLGRVLAAVLQTSWLTVQHTQDLGTVFKGESQGVPTTAEFGPDGRLIHLSLPISKEGDHIDIRVAPEHPGGDWTIDTAGRRKVPSIADLRPRLPEVQPGSRLPALSLMTKDLDAWSLQDELDRTPPERPGVPTIGVLVVYRPAGQTAQADAELGVRALSIAAADLGRAQPDPARRPRLVPLVIAILDLGDMGRAKLVALDAHWGARPGPPPPRYFSPTGAAEMERLSRGSNASVVIIDATQKVLATLPLENRTDAESLAQEIGMVIEGATKFP